MNPRKNNMTVLAQIVKQIPVPDQLQYEMIRCVMQGSFSCLENLYQHILSSYSILCFLTC